LDTRAAHDEHDERKAARMPGGLRWGLIAAFGLVFAGALYLIAVRGEALLLDLSALGGRVFCF
jgi:hypothetical protein